MRTQARLTYQAKYTAAVNYGELMKIYESVQLAAERPTEPSRAGELMNMTRP